MKYTLKFSPDSNILDLNSQVQTPSHMYEEWKPSSELLQDAGGCSPETPLYSHIQTRQEKAAVSQQLDCPY